MSRRERQLIAFHFNRQATKAKKKSIKWLFKRVGVRPTQKRVMTVLNNIRLGAHK